MTSRVRALAICVVARGCLGGDNVFYCFAPTCHHYQIASGANVPWLTPPPGSTGTNYAYGDYDGIAGDPVDGSFHVAWADYRDRAMNSNEPEIWTAQVSGP